MIARYEHFFARTTIQVFPISHAVIERATTLRAGYGLKTPDAIHLATALEEGADCFLTGDSSLIRCPGIQVEVIQS